MSAGFQTANNSCKLNIYILAKPVTSQALPARLHGLCSITRQIRRFLGAPASRQLASCNAISQTSQKELFLCRDSPKNVAKQEKYATLYLISRQKRCFRHPSQNPPAKPPLLPSHSRDFISFWYPAYKHAGIWHTCMPIPLRVYQRERRRNTKKI